MLCKQCWQWRQKVEGINEQLANFDIAWGKYLRKVKNPITAKHLGETLEETRDWLNRRLKLLTGIGDRECRPGRCILCDLGKEANYEFSQSKE